jgi:bifunctional UDP-N-acetylglucosamine pyrophosphorylase/glucosamine-1-phosphate N-acetyltransferase
MGDQDPGRSRTGVAVHLVREQPEQLGTGDAVAVGITGLPESLADADGDVVVLPGDTPLVRAPTLAALVRHHRDTGAAATLLTALLPDPTGHDRVVRGKDDAVISVMEGAEVRFGDDVDEVATTIHCFRHTVMAPALRRLRPLGITGEHS